MKKKNFFAMKKGLALALALSMLVMTGCSNETSNPGEDTTGTTAPTTEVGAPTKEEGAPTEGTNPTEPTGDKLEYTKNEITGSTPLTWNPHEEKTDGNDVLKKYTQMGFYEFVLNDTKDGYEVIPELAADEPIDVTAEYAGNELYGVPADATSGWAYKIPLNPDVCWEDGTPVTADDHMYSHEQLLSPEMKCEAASNRYANAFSIANAESYVKQGQPVYTPIFKDGEYREVKDKDMVFSFTKEVVFFGGTAKNSYDSGSQDNFKAEDGTDLFEKYSKEDYYPLTDEAKADLIAISKNFGDEGENAYKEYCFTFDGIPEAMDFDKVGLIKTGEYELTFVLTKPCTPFFVKYDLSTSYLVHKGLYEANKQKTGDITKTSYATSVDTYMTYAPYKVVEYQPDKQYVLEKNEKWHGNTDGKHEGQFQTTRVVCQVISEHATALQLFMQGKLDSIGLTAEDMGTYRNSDFIYFTPNSYTNKITFNSDKASLVSRQSKGKNKSILSYVDFRKAVSLSLDRERFAAECYATSRPGFGLLNDLYICDPDTGERYRYSDAGIQVLLDVYGVSTMDDLTGYNKDEASKLFTSAYEQAVAAGDMQADDIVEIEFVVYKSTETSLKLVNFIKEAVQQGAMGSPLENKIEFKVTPDEDYYNHSKQGLFDVIITSWGGNAFNPFDVSQVYCDDTKIFEYGFKPSVEKLTIEVNGESITKTYFEWSRALTEGEYVGAEMDVKTTILAGIEKGILEKYICPPYLYSTTTGLRSRKINFGSEEYIEQVEYGGIRFTTYNMDDVAWEAYCKENNYQLSY